MATRGGTYLLNNRRLQLSAIVFVLSISNLQNTAHSCNPLKFLYYTDFSPQHNIANNAYKNILR